MSRPNRVYNGDLSRDLDNWSAAGSATFVAGQGNLERGCARLPAAGAAISQVVSVPVSRTYTLQVATYGPVAGSVTATLTSDAGDEIWSGSLTVGTTWKVREIDLGLPWGSHTLALTYDDVDVYVDDISLAHVVATRAALATMVHDRLGVLATDASMTTLASGAATEGDYTDAVDTGLRKVEAVDAAGRVDVRYLTSDNLDACLGEIELAMLHRLHRYWSTKTGYTIGPRTEQLQQVSAGIERLIGIADGGRAGSGRTVKQRRLYHREAL